MAWDPNETKESNPYSPPVIASAEVRIPDSRPRSRGLRGLVMFQGIVIFCAVAAEAIDIESIMVSGPIFAFVGLIIAIWAVPCRSIPAFLLGISAVAFAILIYVLIDVLGWSPSDADRPVQVMSWVYALAALFFSLLIVRPNSPLHAGPNVASEPSQENQDDHDEKR